VEKHRSNSQYFKRKKLQSKIFNELNIKKSKIEKDNFAKKNKKKKEGGKLGKKKVKKMKKRKKTL
jgi:phosphoribulokinase